ncbi:TonB-dependent receptor [Adhaeribacter sp. BT258]|uniref:TonB-dependent receptor n=1 Tax=Adhaeribacter terrigena TaxID=2793070 RepID=A0ABS1C3K8_9BACT|nr:TonB-dependent receptor [Adhaeribacter terrigena]MBK0403974.1 TonB-dependent receptor [Adhaeribacter terrigena]
MVFKRLQFYFCGLVLLLVWSAAPAQTQYTVSGTLRDASTREPLIGATAMIAALNKGATTDLQGNYAFSVPEGSYTIQFSYLGYQTISREIAVTKDLELQIALSASENQLQEVVIEAGNLNEKLRTTQMSVENLTTREAKLLPALFGEVDLIKVLQLKPGVQSGGEGTSGLYVRGGGADQNLFLVDGATVYNASHLFGFFSIFNPDAVHSVDLYKGGFPAQYGGRLSSVVDINMREGNKQHYVTSGGIGLIASRVTVEGPIQKNRSSFLLSGRRTYFDVFTRKYNDINEGKKDFDPIPDYYFYDFNGKASFEIGEKDKLFFTGYFGNDVFGFQSPSGFNFDFKWGNKVGALRWNHQFSPKFFTNTTVSVSDYQYNITNKVANRSFNLGSSIRDYSFRSDSDLLLDSAHTLKFGASATHHNFGVGRLSGGTSDGTVAFNSEVAHTGTEFGVYISDDFNVNSRLALNYGVRLSGFAKDTSVFFGLEPRFSARYNLTESLSLKGSYTRMVQYVHLVTNSGASLPTDVWYPSNNIVKPQLSNQVAVGVTKLFGQGRFLFSNEVYYKWMNRQIDFRDGAQLFVNPNLDQEFIFGKGYSYGSEFYFEKKTGKTTGWLGYTLSWTNRKFPDINQGKIFPTRFDRRHDVTFVVLHQLNKRLNLTGSWVYGTGSSYSVPLGKTVFQDIAYANVQYVPLYPQERNNYRMVAYHRLDLGMVYKLKPKRGESDLTFSIYNVYNRKNPYFIYIDAIENGDETKILGFRAKQVSLFPVIPAVTYNFKF